MNTTKSIIGGALLLLASVAPGSTQDMKDYVGPFPTQTLYDLCSEPASREKCNLYIQGLLYGINRQRIMHELGAPVCLPEMTIETARLNILQLIDGITGGRPSNNKDGGDWMAFMAVVGGHYCPDTSQWVRANDLTCTAERDAYVRLVPDGDSIGTIHTGDIFALMEVKGEWIHTQVNRSLDGWISNKVLDCRWTPNPR